MYVFYKKYFCSVFKCVRIIDNNVLEFTYRGNGRGKRILSRIYVYLIGQPNQ